MEQPSFSRIPESGFLGFVKELGQDPWASVDVSAYLDDKLVVLQPLATAPLVVGHKVALLLTLGDLSRARDGTYGAPGATRSGTASRAPSSACSRWLSATTTR